MADGWTGHLEGGVWGQDGWQGLAAAGAPRRRVVGGVGMGGMAAVWAGHLEGGVWGQDNWQVLAAAGAPRRMVVGGAGVVAVG